MRTRTYLRAGLLVVFAAAGGASESSPQERSDGPAVPGGPAGVEAAAPQIVDQPPATAKPSEPSEVDLRPRLLELGLPPRAQGARGTCSIFTTCEAIEFALARSTGKSVRLSPEFANWAAGQAAGRPSDGNFFHNALAGFKRRGVCAESLMPYQEKFDAARAPSEAALADAAKTGKHARSGLAVRWIVPWKANRFGLDDSQFARVKRVLASGYPVAAGSGHSRLLVGYKDDVAKPGGGTFMTEDSALNRFDEVTYEFVRKEVADVFWVEAVTTPADAAKH